MMFAMSCARMVRLVAVSGLFLAASAGIAQTWTGADMKSDLWNSQLNWDVQAVPEVNDTVAITGGFVLIDDTVADASCAVMHGPGWYNSGLCGLNITGGRLTVANYIQMGASNASNGRIRITNGTLNVSKFYIGYQGYAHIDMTGGTITASSITFPWTDGIGKFDLHGGTVNAGSFDMSCNVNGLSKMDITAGKLVIDGDQRAIITQYIQKKWITGYAERSDLSVTYSNGKTIVTAQAPDIWTAENPSPGNGLKNVAQFPLVLGWAKGKGASAQELYFGKSLSDVNIATKSTAGIFCGTQPSDNNSYTVADQLIPEMTYYWRVDALSSAGHRAKGSVWSFTAAGIDANAASDPNPRDGAGYVYPGITISWKPGSGAVSHRLYLGSDYNDIVSFAEGAVENRRAKTILYKEDLSGSSFKPEAMERGKNYFWRVDEVFAGGIVIKGPVWSMTTASAQRGVIIAASDANHAAQRLKNLITQETGLDFTVVSPGQRYNSGHLQFVLCTKKTRSEVKQFLSAAAMSDEIKPQGFSIVTDSNATCVSVVGADIDGLRYGVGELWHYHCALYGMTVQPQKSMSLFRSPAYPKRIFWNWLGYTNWDDDLSRVHQTKNVDTNGKLEPSLAQPNGFVNLVKKVVDFQADHKLNGLILWGFLNDAHGGVGTAKTVSSYAKNNSVRIMPGIGTMGYGGFYCSGSSPYNVYNFMRAHPEVNLLVTADGNSMPDTPCPSDPVFQQWIRDGATWFFSTLTDIGGVNLEHGDYFLCHCIRCKELRLQPQNDNNCYWDMMYSQVPVIQAGLAINSDLWCTYASYDPYNAAMVSSPPKFLGQYPEAAITQWTYTKMIADPILNPSGSWPASLHPPAGTKHSIGLLHQGSHWDVTRQWWGMSDPAFGGTYALISDLIQWACRRAVQDNSEGIELIGQIGIASPQNELNYLAFEAFTWNPQLDYQTWIDQELAPLYGGSQLSRRFYELVSSTTVLPQDISGAIAEAQQNMKKIKDPRQARRWNNLILELRRRLVLKQ